MRVSTVPTRGIVIMNEVCALSGKGDHRFISRDRVLGSTICHFCPRNLISSHTAKVLYSDVSKLMRVRT